MKGESIYEKIEPHLPKKEKEEPILVRKAEEVILEKLEKKVGIIAEITEIVNNTKLEENPEKVKEKFLHFQERVFAQYPKTYPLFKEYKSLSQEEEKKRNRYLELERKLSTTKLSEAEIKEYEKLEKEKEKIETQLKQLTQKGGVNFDFLISIYYGINSLLDSFKFVQEIKNDRNLIIQKLKEAFRFKFETKEEEEKMKEHIQDIIINNPFAINIILDKDYFEHLVGKKTIEGVHCQGSPFSLIKAMPNSKFISETIKHETNHAILKNFIPLRYSPARRLKLILEHPTKFEKLKTPKWLIEDTKKQRYNFLKKIPVQEIIDGLHLEILADINIISQHLLEPLEPSESDYPVLLKLAGLDLEEKLNKKLGFSTCQNEFNRIREILMKFHLKKDEEPEIREYCQKLKGEIEKSFLETIQEMRRALFISKHLNNELEIHSLLILLPPSKYRHIKRYLQFRFGKELLERYNSLYDFYSNPDKISFKTLQNIELLKEELTEEEVKVLKLRIEEIDDSNFAEFTNDSDLNSLSLKSLREYFSKFESLNSKLGFKKDFLNRFQKKIYWNYFNIFLINNLRDNFKKLPSLFRNLNEEERKTFLETFEDYCQTFMEEDLTDIYKQKINLAFIQKLPLWEVLQKLGLEQITKEGIKKYEEEYEKGN